MKYCDDPMAVISINGSQQYPDPDHGFLSVRMEDRGEKVHAMFEGDHPFVVFKREVVQSTETGRDKYSRTNYYDFDRQIRVNVESDKDFQRETLSDYAMAEPGRNILAGTDLLQS